MLLYLIIIFCCAAVLAAANCIWGLSYLGLNVWQTIGIVLLCLVVSILLDALCAIVTRKLENKINPFAKMFKEHKNERKFFEKLKIRKWKDKIPELGKTLKYFDKTKLEENAGSEYYLKFIKETCIGEVIHIASIPLAVLLIVVFGFNFLTITIPVTIANILLQLPSICVLRYTRTKLSVAYKLKLRQENKTQTQNWKL